MAKVKEKDYCVTYAIDARHVVHVRAKSISEALEKAEGEYLDADFGELAKYGAQKIIYLKNSRFQKYSLENYCAGLKKLLETNEKNRKS